MAQEQKKKKASTRGASGRKRPMLLEISWEVCRQVGGIYTVIRSKVPYMVETCHERYCLVGPYDPAVSPLEFEPAVDESTICQTVKAMREQGHDVHYGRWLVTGEPRTVLINPRLEPALLDKAKYLLWEHHDISTPTGDELLDDVVGFGYLFREFIAGLRYVAGERYPLVLHFHEWMASSAIPGLRRTHDPSGIVFTTHATQLGRILAQHNGDFYEHIPFVDWLADSRKYGIEPQTRIERAAAHGAHVLTTVSDVTAYECQHILARKCDLLVPNGLNVERFVALHEFQNLHRQYKEQIHQFVMSMFFPSYTFDLDKTLYFFTSGRYEYRNKGFDLTLEAMARLNSRLKANRSGRTVVCFLITRRPFRGINAEVLRRAAMLQELRRNCEQIKDHIGERLFECAAKGIVPDFEQLVGDYWKLRLQRMMHAWHVPSLPTVITHDLYDDQDDAILKQLRYLNLINQATDPVKVVYHPDFVTSSNPLLSMEYDQFVRGCHLGIFPSFYEPWGYTPLECIARGLPAVTSDLSGFGTHVLENMPEAQSRGIYVTKRRGQSFDAAAADLTEWLMEFCWLGRRERIDTRNRVEATSDRFDWQVLGKRYAQAHRMAREHIVN